MRHQANRQSLRSTLIQTSLLISTLFIVLTAFVLERAFYHALWERTKQQLEAQIYTLMAVADLDSQGQLILPRYIADERFNHWGGGRYARVLRPDGSEVWRSESAVGRTWPPPSKVRQGDSLTRISYIDAVEVIEHTYRVAWEVNGRDDNYLFVVAENYQDFAVALTSFRWRLFISLALLGVVILFGQFVVFRRMLKPLAQVQAELQAIELGQRARLDEGLPIELAGLVARINRLLSFEEAQRQRFQNSVGDLAHSLKTPLTMIANEANSDRPDAACIRDAVSRADQLVQYYLNRARAVGRGSTQQKVSLRTVIQNLLEAMNKVYADKGVTVEFESADEGTLRGHEGDMLELFGNLIDNAFKYCRGAVLIALTMKDASPVVTIEDDGSGIPDRVKESVFERGRRMDEKMAGHGLGLSIAANIVQAYEGKIEVARSPLGGAKVTVTLQA